VALPTFSVAPNPKNVCPTQIVNDQRKKQNGACKPEIEIASDRNKIFAKFQRLDLYFPGRPIQRMYVRR